MIKERFRVPGGIQVQDLDQNLGYSGEILILEKQRAKHTGRAAISTAPVLRPSAAATSCPSASSCSQDVTAGSVVTEFKIFFVYPPNLESDHSY